jgi:hypothetical protein
MRILKHNKLSEVAKRDSGKNDTRDTTKDA